MTPPATLTCPLCGAPNDCGLANCDRPGTPCWCQEAQFPAALLAKLPENQRGVSCICASCAGVAASRLAG